MSSFIQALADPSMPFIRYALIAGIISSAAFGMVGSFVVVRRISYIAGAVSHAALAGLGGSLYLQVVHDITWFSPLLGATVAALLSAWIIALVNLYAAEREDTIIGAIWAVGMAVGLLFIAKTPGYMDPMSYLFGNILLIGKADLLLIMALNLLVIVLVLLFYPQLQAVCFDEPYARTRKVPTGFFMLLLVTLTAVTVVLMVSTVGIVMVIAMLTLPAATAGLFARRLSGMMLYGGLICAFSNVAGLYSSYSLDVPTGAMTILVSGGLYVAALVVRSIQRRFRLQRGSSEYMYSNSATQE
ncbi:metal ABC transporter permease [Marispirochaeta sp.]|jgi:zinc transport system permease protein|uniref:metal ABC transporter permease n=1 Tax=Marispirochaeta sp. TaxID=2038653 RepID=UPI0029C840EA|nr:metal ABC transporter permease [Marispirochaeta sp.]